MVTEPDLRTADEAAQYLIRLRQLLRGIGISEADMEKGNLRCDANVSSRPVGATHLNEKTVIKNVNSTIPCVKPSVRDRRRRARWRKPCHQSLDAGMDQDAGVWRKMRAKETEADYRYVREPDLLPLRISAEWKTAILTNFPERPLERRARFMRELQPPETTRTSSRWNAPFRIISKRQSSLRRRFKESSNWLMTTCCA